MNEIGVTRVKTLFSECAHHLRDMMALTQIAMKGTRQISKQVAIVKALHQVNLLRQSDASLLTQQEREVEEAEEEAAFARKEVDAGYPFAQSQATIAMWARLEAFIEDLLVTCFETDAQFLEVEQVGKVKIAFGQYEQMSSTERMYYVVDSLQRDTQSKFKHGVSQFDVLFDILGIGGPVEEPTKRNLFEMSNIRNVLVHRRALADKRLAMSCPWLGLKIGDQVKITTGKLFSYQLSCMIYVGVATRRVLKHWGADVEPVSNYIRLLAKSVLPSAENKQSDMD